MRKCAEHGMDEGMAKQALFHWTHHLVPWQTQVEKNRLARRANEDASRNQIPYFYPNLLGPTPDESGEYREFLKRLEDLSGRQGSRPLEFSGLRSPAGDAPADIGIGEYAGRVGSVVPTGNAVLPGGYKSLADRGAKALFEYRDANGNLTTNAVPLWSSEPGSEGPTTPLASIVRSLSRGGK